MAERPASPAQAQAGRGKPLDKGNGRIPTTPASIETRPRRLRGEPDLFSQSQASDELCALPGRGLADWLRGDRGRLQDTGQTTFVRIWDALERKRRGGCIEFEELDSINGTLATILGKDKPIWLSCACLKYIKLDIFPLIPFSEPTDNVSYVM